MPVYTYTTLDDPLANAPNGTLAQGINASGQIVGSYADAGVYHGFLYSGGAYTTLEDPLATNGTTAAPINTATTSTTLDEPATPAGRPAYDSITAGQLVVCYRDASNHPHGFLYSGGTYTTLDDPLAGAAGSFAYGINNAGQVV